MKIKAVLEALDQFCEKEKLRAVLVGALALATYGMQRNTKDIDVLIDESDQDKWKVFLESLGYETLHRPLAPDAR